MANLNDLLARQSAAGGLMREAPESGAGLSPEEGPSAEMMPPEMGEGGDVEGALAMLEQAIAGMDEKIAEEIREHANAIREIATKDTGPALAEREAPPEGEAPEEPKIEV